jgi:hypothetical protein
MFTPNLIVGLAIMGIGLVLVLERFGLVNPTEVLKFWPVLLVLFGASVAVQSLRRRDPLAPTQNQKAVIAPGFVLFVVIIAMLGTNGFRAWSNTEASTGEERISVFGIMSSPRRTSTSSNFRGAQLGGVMGRSTLDLRQAAIAPGEDAVVDVFVAMGKVVLRVPDHWTVDTSTLPVMGSIDDLRWPRDRAVLNINTGDVEKPADTGKPADVEAATPATGPPPRLVLRGFVMMGKVEIQS